MLGALITLIILTAISDCLIIYQFFRKEKQSSIFSTNFQDKFETIGLPVLTVTLNNTPINLIIDSGSTTSYLDKSLMPIIGDNYTKKSSLNVFGIAGNSGKTKRISTTLCVNGKDITSDFLIRDLSKSFSPIEESTGVQIHGLLGSDFLNENSAVLDFAAKTFEMKCNE